MGEYKCPKCGSYVAEEDIYCEICGAKLPKTVHSAEHAICPKCKKPLESGASFCVYCGAPVKKAAEKKEEESGFSSKREPEVFKPERKAPVIEPKVSIAEEETSEGETEISGTEPTPIPPRAEKKGIKTKKGKGLCRPSELDL